MAVGQLQIFNLIHRHRRQASSHTWVHFMADNV